MLDLLQNQKQISAKSKSKESEHRKKKRAFHSTCKAELRNDVSITHKDFFKPITKCIIRIETKDIFIMGCSCTVKNNFNISNHRLNNSYIRKKDRDFTVITISKSIKRDQIILIKDRQSLSNDGNSLLVRVWSCSNIMQTLPTK